MDELLLFDAESFIGVTESTAVPRIGLRDTTVPVWSEVVASLRMASPTGLQNLVLVHIPEVTAGRAYGPATYLDPFSTAIVQWNDEAQGQPSPTTFRLMVGSDYGFRLVPSRFQLIEDPMVDSPVHDAQPKRLTRRRAAIETALHNFFAVFASGGAIFLRKDFQDQLKHPRVR